MSLQWLLVSFSQLLFWWRLESCEATISPRPEFIKKVHPPITHLANSNYLFGLGVQIVELLEGADNFFSFYSQQCVEQVPPIGAKLLIFLKIGA